MISIRICRHCHTTVGLNDVKCRHCKKRLMSPVRFKLVLATMAIILIVALGFLVYGVVLYERAIGACAAVGC